MIKTIIFDLGGVIVPLDFERAYSRIGSSSPYPVEEIPKRIGSTDLVRRYESGLVTTPDFVEQISHLLDLKVDHEEFCELWSSIFPPYTLIPDALLEDLKGYYRLLLLSNTNEIHFSMIRARYPILRHFDDFVLSYEVKALKPAPVIYQEAIARAGCPAEECFYTDDVAAYVEGARQQGIDAVQFVSFEQLCGELRNREIKAGGSS